MHIDGSKSGTSLGVVRTRTKSDINVSAGPLMMVLWDHVCGGQGVPNRSHRCIRETAASSDAWVEVDGLALLLLSLLLLLRLNVGELL